MSQRYEFFDRRFEARSSGQALSRIIRDEYAGASWNDARRLVTSGKVFIDGNPARDPGELVTYGAVVDVRMTTRSDARAAMDVDLVHVDSQIIVANKPSGISTVPYDRTELDTLEARILLALKSKRPAGHGSTLHVVHRIDKETSGLVVFARTESALRTLKHQFRVHSVERRYKAIVHGTIGTRTFDSRLVPNRGDGLRGSTEHPNLGQRAVTNVRAIEPLARATFVECKLETGRTHQIRVHLSEAGHPLVGEKVYVRDYEGPLLEAPRLMLHAETLGVIHPSRNVELSFTAPLPDDMRAVLESLRGDRNRARSQGNRM